MQGLLKGRVRFFLTLEYIKEKDREEKKPRENIRSSWKVSGPGCEVQET